MRRATTAVAAAAVVVATLSGCVPDPVVSYGAVDQTSEVCGPAERGGALIVGDSFDTLDRPATLIEVELVDADGLEFDRVWYTPRDEAVGVYTTPVPDDVPWHPTEALGVEVPPGITQTFAVEVTRTAEVRGSASALALTFDVDGVQHRVVGTLAIVVRSSCADEPL